jgi:pimeloyl-ACP methyl ester carboxylesterase
MKQWIFYGILWWSIILLTAHSFHLTPNEISLVDGKRCLFVPSKSEQQYPLLVILGGMAQAIASWEHQLPALSRNRNVLVYECLGLGAASENQDCSNVTLPFQAQTLMYTLDKLIVPSRHDDDDNDNDEQQQHFDIVGFSFGARVAMATACLYPERIRRLHLTGVAADRSDYGHLALQAWKDSVIHDSSLRSFAWSVLLATYSPSFLRSQGPPKIEKWIDSICQTNHVRGLQALLDQAEVNDPQDAWHVMPMAERLEKTKIRGHVCVGEYDQMAPLPQARLLCGRLGWSEPSVISNCGHAVGLESPRQWRDNVLEFLN